MCFSKNSTGSCVNTGTSFSLCLFPFVTFSQSISLSKGSQYKLLLHCKNNHYTTAQVPKIAKKK